MYCNYLDNVKLGIFDRIDRINKIRVEALALFGSPYYPVHPVNPVHFSKHDIVELLRFAGRVQDRPRAAVLVAVAAADGRPLHVEEVFAAPTGHFHLLNYAQQPLTHPRVENQVRTGVSLQNIGHRAGLAQPRLPGRRFPVARNQPAFLDIAAPVIVGIVIATFFPCWCSHFSPRRIGNRHPQSPVTHPSISHLPPCGYTRVR
jgi:hypothetical protein